MDDEEDGDVCCLANGWGIAEEEWQGANGISAEAAGLGQVWGDLGQEARGKGEVVEPGQDDGYAEASDEDDDALACQQVDLVYSR